MSSPSDTNSTSITAEASRRLLANEPTAPPSKRSTAAVASATSTSGGDRGRVARRGGADHDRLAEDQPGQVVQMGRLLDDLAAALVDPAPPGRRWRPIQPARDDQARRIGGQTLADLGHDVERAEVVADGDDEAGPVDRVGQPRRTVGIGGGERLLDEERDPALDQALAHGHRAMWRHRHVDDLGCGLVEHAVDLVEARPAPSRDDRVARLAMPGHDADQPGATEPTERLEVLAADPAAADQPQPEGHPSVPKMPASRNGAVSSS